MSVVYSSSYGGELRKNQEFMMDSSSYYLQQSSNQHHNNNTVNPGLMRYRSAPCSFLDSLVNSATSASTSVTATTAAGFEDYRCPSLESEGDTFFIMSSNGTSGTNSASASGSGSGSHDHMVVDYGHGDKGVKQELDQSRSVSEENGCNSNGSEMMYQTSFGLPTSLGNENGSNLIRQSSSPAEFFSNLGLDDHDGFNLMRKVNTFQQACDGSNDESKSTSSRVYHSDNISFASGPSSRSRHMPGIAEVENESMGMNGPENGHFISNLRTDSWSNASLSGFKRARDSDRDLFSNLHVSQTQNQDQYRDRPTALTHHLSLPKTSAEMAAVEKLWQFQGSVPCKIRAKRGCATHPRSIAERVRRTRISERMRKLQGLFPNIDKTNTADMLDMAVEYIKDLQKQVKTLKDTKAKCACIST